MFSPELCQPTKEQKARKLVQGRLKKAIGVVTAVAALGGSGSVGYAAFDYFKDIPAVSQNNKPCPPIEDAKIQRMQNIMEKARNATPQPVDKAHPKSLFDSYN